MTEQAPSHLFAWVLSPLTRFVPNWFRAMFLGAQQTRKLVVADGTVRPNQGRGQTVALALLTDQQTSSPFKTEQVIDAVMPTSLFLRRLVSAPASASRNLKAIAQLDLQRQTPFEPSDINWILGARRKKGGQIEVEQWIAKKGELNKFKTNLADKGLKVRRFLVSGAEEFGPIADYSDAISPNARRWRVLNGALVVFIAGCLVVTWLYPAWALGPRLKTLQMQSKELRAQALELRPKIEQYRAYDQEKAAFLDIVNRRTLLSEALRELTIALPDSVWVESLSFASGKLVFGGETKQSAPELVLALSRNVHFGDPRLKGAVSNTTTGAERFEITLDLGGAK